MVAVKTNRGAGSLIVYRVMRFRDSTRFSLRYDEEAQRLLLVVLGL
jgi:hypothetical protein